jgi:hypothetical protein
MGFLFTVGGFALAVTVIPGVAAFLRPSWIGRIIVVGVVLSFAEWTTGWFGDSGDLGRGGAVVLAGVWALVTLALWVIGAASGRAIRLWRNRRRDAQPAASALSSPR